MIAMTDQFPVEEFDSWAKNYDQSVANNQQFPFIGYEAALDKILELAAPKSGLQVLDLGIGTGNLALKFDALGCQIWGTDFSTEMLVKARKKLPKAKLFQADLRSDWPPDLSRRFDRIVSGYVFHHFKLNVKVQIIKKLVHEHLEPTGSLLIADIAFQNQNALEQMKRAVGEEWEDEFYWLADESTSAFEKIGLKVQFLQVSPCAGVFAIHAGV
jgi:putative AdoMet-dependent methyltransferase